MIEEQYIDDIAQHLRENGCVQMKNREFPHITALIEETTMTVLHLCANCGQVSPKMIDLAIHGAADAFVEQHKGCV